MLTPTTQQRPTALQVAKFLVKLAHDEEKALIRKGEGDPMRDEIKSDMTNLKLQKVLYFAQGAYLALNDDPLFDDDIEAWGLGPVVPSVYQCFKDHGRNVIDSSEGDDAGISDYQKSFLSEIWVEFGKYSAAQLVDLTHQHAPWRIARERGEKIISKEDMKAFYRKIFVPVDESAPSTR